MTVARIIPKRIRDQQDANLTLGAGTNGYGIAYNHTTGLFEMAALESAGVAAGLITAHVGLSNPHTQYLLASGYTAADLLSKLLTVDGSGSGLDADLLDGLSSAAFEAVGTAAGLITAHVAAANPHGQYTLASSFTTHQALTTAHGISAYGATLVDDTDATAARGTLGLGTMATQADTAYLLAAGATTGATSQAQAFTNGIIASKIYPSANSTNALGFYRANGTTQDFYYDSTNGRFSVGGVPTISAFSIITDTGGPSNGLLFENTGGTLSPNFTIKNTSGTRFIRTTGTDILFMNGAGSPTHTFGAAGELTISGLFSVAGLTVSHPNGDPTVIFTSGAANSSTSLRLISRVASVDKGWFIQNRGPADSPNNRLLFFDTSVVERFTILDGGGIGINQSNPTSFLDVPAGASAKASLRIRSGTWPTTPNDGDIVNNGSAIAMMVNGTSAVNTDGGLAVWMQSSTTARNVGRLLWQYTDKTDATRATRGSVTAFHTSTEHKPITWGANSGGALLSFYDIVTPIARQVLATGAGRTVDDVITTLQALGLVKQS